MPQIHFKGVFYYESPSHTLSDPQELQKLEAHLQKTNKETRLLLNDPHMGWDAPDVLELTDGDARDYTMLEERIKLAEQLNYHKENLQDMQKNLLKSYIDRAVKLPGNFLLVLMEQFGMKS